MKKELVVSVIVPVCNARNYLARCLDALLASTYRRFEVIVVDDASTDNSAALARQRGVTVLELPTRSGPAAARNHGVQHAMGEVFLFVDSDVVVRPDTISRVVADLECHPEFAAVFGSYDDSPPHRGWVSSYKNLYHHFVHQNSNSEATTFWAGCGAIRRRAFRVSRGFDRSKYHRPAIEDIELGCRLRSLGYRILLDKQLQVTHLKQWNLKSLLHADILCRAVPWCNLIFENQQMPRDLNLKMADRVSAGCIGISLFLASLALGKPSLLTVSLLLLCAVAILNWKLLAFLAKRRGSLFVVFAFALLIAYYFYSGATFALCWVRHRLRALSMVQVPRRVPAESVAVLQEEQERAS